MTQGTPGLTRRDLDAYLRRIDHAGDLRPAQAVLEGLHLAHMTHIPFENLNILLGRPIRLDLESLLSKLVTEERGGYCFEQNLLFAAVLSELGFSVRKLAARVKYRTDRLLPRTHMTLLVEAEGSSCLADVGFGAEGPLLPVPFESGREARQFAWTYRVVEQAGQWILQARRQEEPWMDLYAFTLEPQEVVDYEMASYYTSTHPDSRFVQTLTVQLPAPGLRRTLRNRELTIDTGEKVTSRILAGDEELLEVLAGTFGLRFPPGTRFRFRDPIS